jgi:hypothetical protein
MTKKSSTWRPRATTANSCPSVPAPAAISGGTRRRSGCLRHPPAGGRRRIPALRRAIARGAPPRLLRRPAAFWRRRAVRRVSETPDYTAVRRTRIITASVLRPRSDFVGELGPAMLSLPQTIGIWHKHLRTTHNATSAPDAGVIRRTPRPLRLRDRVFVHDEQS